MEKEKQSYPGTGGRAARDQSEDFAGVGAGAGDAARNRFEGGPGKDRTMKTENEPSAKLNRLFDTLPTRERKREVESRLLWTTVGRLNHQAKMGTPAERDWAKEALESMETELKEVL